MIEDFFNLCKSNDSGLRSALGQVRRGSVLGQFMRQFGFEEQDFYLLAIDRAFLENPDCNRGFLLTVKKYRENIVFDAYIDFVDDMYSIGHVDLNSEASSLEQNQNTIESIEKKLNSLNLPNGSTITLSQLLSILSENEYWFAKYLTKYRWTFENEHSFEQRELFASLNMYKTITSLNKEYNLTNASSLGE